MAALRLFAGEGGPGPSHIADRFPGKSAVPSIKTAASAAVFTRGALLFTDRTFAAGEFPAFLEKGVFLQSTISSVEISCEQPGLVIALSPVPKPGAASQETALLQAGFESMSSGEFQLFPGEVNRVRGYSKTLKAGEHLRLLKWVVLVFPPGTVVTKSDPVSPEAPATAQGELLYNGIVVPAQWPPQGMNPASRAVMPVPYLAEPPKVIPISLGRQLFVDDFLIESTGLVRNFHSPEKFSGNPILKPETALERPGGSNACAAPFSDGVFYDAASRELKMWYQAGWSGGTALATSTDGLHWQRPVLDVTPKTNHVLPENPFMRRDGASIWIDSEAADPAERYKMLVYVRYGRLGEPIVPGEAHVLTSPDGIHWKLRRQIKPAYDNTTFFYNPFRRKWVFAIKSSWGGKRTRDYWEITNFVTGGSAGDPDPVFWLSTDTRDQPDPSIGDQPELYKLDAVAYESLMVGLFQVHYGPINAKAAALGVPKITDLQVGFSRDGFHWDRPNRKAFIAASRTKGDWDRGYITCAGGCFVVTDDSLLFYFAGFKGDESRRGGDYWSGMYANGATGLAILRRDGFASMDAGAQEETLVTRPVVFDGSWLFVNLEATHGRMLVEILDEEGQPLPSFSKANCLPVTGNSTRQQVQWKNAPSLETLKGRPVRFRFFATNAQFYSFWVSPHPTGESGGYLAAGALGHPFVRDTKSP